MGGGIGYQGIERGRDGSTAFAPGQLPEGPFEHPTRPVCLGQYRRRRLGPPAGNRPEPGRICPTHDARLPSPVDQPVVVEEALIDRRGKGPVDGIDEIDGKVTADEAERQRPIGHDANIAPVFAV